MGRIEGGEEEEAAGLEPVTPAGRFFIQPKVQNIIHFVVGGRLPLDNIDAIKLAFKDTFLLHPRFCSLMVRDKRGRERWKKTEVDIDKHFIVPVFADRPALDDDDDDFVNRYLAELAVSAPLDEAKPLWEVHVMESRRICVIRLHHALGDGISLMSLFMACCYRAGEAVAGEVLQVGGDGVVELGVHCGVHVECLGEGRGDEHLRRGWGGALAEEGGHC